MTMASNKTAPLPLRTSATSKLLEWPVHSSAFKRDMGLESASWIMATKAPDSDIPWQHADALASAAFQTSDVRVASMAKGIGIDGSPSKPYQEIKPHAMVAFGDTSHAATDPDKMLVAAMVHFPQNSRDVSASQRFVASIVADCSKVYSEYLTRQAELAPSWIPKKATIGPEHRGAVSTYILNHASQMLDHASVGELLACGDLLACGHEDYENLLSHPSESHRLDQGKSLWLAHDANKRYAGDLPAVYTEGDQITYIVDVESTGQQSSKPVLTMCLPEAHIKGGPDPVRAALSTDDSGYIDTAEEALSLANEVWSSLTETGPRADYITELAHKLGMKNGHHDVVSKAALARAFIASALQSRADADTCVLTDPIKSRFVWQANPDKRCVDPDTGLVDETCLSALPLEHQKHIADALVPHREEVERRAAEQARLREEAEQWRLEAGRQEPHAVPEEEEAAEVNDIDVGSSTLGADGTASSNPPFTNAQIRFIRNLLDEQRDRITQEVTASVSASIDKEYNGKRRQLEGRFTDLGNKVEEDGKHTLKQYMLVSDEVGRLGERIGWLHEQVLARGKKEDSST